MRVWRRAACARVPSTPSTCSTAPTARVREPMEVRRYRESDRAQLVALWRRAMPSDLPRNEPNLMIDTKLAVDDLIFVAAEDDAIHGAAIAGYDGHRGWLYSVAVDEPVRRKRVGSA